MQPSDVSWFRNTVLYQIYPRSFFDATGDGVGDLRGITERLHYLAGEDDSLGVGAIWLSPFYPSPMADFGYDVTDYTGVDPLFGTLEDFKRLLDEAHLRGLKVIIDFIPNHTSDQHPWFQESKKDKQSPRRNWYIWRDGKPEGGPPNNWLSVFGGSAWEYDEETGQYYLHSFLKEQPDLNWENAGVREAMKHALQFWLNLGVDGFRVDAVYWLSKDPEFRDDPPKDNVSPEQKPYDSLVHAHSKEGPKLYEYLRFITNVVKAYRDRFVIVEASSPLEGGKRTYVELYENTDPTICAPFNFDGLFTPWKASEFKKMLHDFQKHMHADYVPVYSFGNHDQPRIRSRINSSAARALAVIQLTLPGMPVIYYGDEIGMENGDIGPEDIHDPSEILVPGLGLGRDPERTPLQWDDSNYAGFSQVKPWLPVHEAYVQTNIAREQGDPTSYLSLYKRLILFRKHSEALRYGSYNPIEIHEDVLCYERKVGDNIVVVAVNFSDQDLTIEHESLYGTFALSSYADTTVGPVYGSVRLRGNEAVILRVD